MIPRRRTALRKIADPRITTPSFGKIIYYANYGRYNYVGYINLPYENYIKHFKKWAEQNKTFVHKPGEALNFFEDCCVNDILFHSKKIKRHLKDVIKNAVYQWDEYQIEERKNNPDDYDDNEKVYVRTTEEEINAYIKKALEKQNLKTYIENNFLRFTVVEFIEEKENKNIEEEIKKYIKIYSTHIAGFNHEVRFNEKEDDEEQGKGNYIVYKHTSPSNKSYIGITGRDPEIRWKKGWGYSEQPKFFNAIKKYGWENFTHEILEEGLSLKKAWAREKYYISKFDSFGNGYNADEGGQRYT